MFVWMLQIQCGIVEPLEPIQYIIIKVAVRWYGKKRS